MVETETRLRVAPAEACLFAEEDQGKAFPLAAALLSAVAGPIVETVLDTALGALKEAAGPEDVTVEATRNFIATWPAAKQHSFPRCLHVVYGKFFTTQRAFDRRYDADPAEFDEMVRGATGSAPEAFTIQESKSFSKEWLWLAEQPHFFAEFALWYNQDAGAFEPTVTRLTYSRLIGTSRFGESEGERDLVVKLFIGGLNQQGVFAKGTEMTFTFEEMRTGTVRSYDNGVYALPWYPIVTSEAPATRTVAAAVVETREASVFLGALQKIGTAAKPTVQSEILARIDPAKLAEAAVAEETAVRARESAIGTLARNTLDANNKIRTLLSADEAERGSAAIDAYNAIIAANQYARQNGLNEPFAAEDVAKVRAAFSSAATLPESFGR